MLLRIYPYVTSATFYAVILCIRPIEISPYLFKEYHICTELSSPQNAKKTPHEGVPLPKYHIPIQHSHNKKRTEWNRTSSVRNNAFDRLVGPQSSHVSELKQITVKITDKGQCQPQENIMKGVPVTIENGDRHPFTIILIGFLLKIFS